MKVSPTTIDFLSPLTVVPGLGERRVDALRRSGLETVGDLLQYFPRRYIDRTSPVALSELPRCVDQECSVTGRVARSAVERGGCQRLRASIEDGTGTMEAVWFQGFTYLRSRLRVGARILLTGKVTWYGKPQMVHPLVEELADGRGVPDVPYLPLYRITLAMREAGIGQKTLQKAVQWLVRTVKHYPRVLPPALEERKAFPPLAECIAQMHQPTEPARRDICQERLVYEQLYTVALMLRTSRRSFERPGRALDPGPLWEQFSASLPFSLTEGQRAAVSTLLDDSRESRRMHRLLQGDVGSGKTIVAFCACLPALANGHQVAWLAPTEVLACQTWSCIQQWLSPLGFEAGLLTGSVSSKRGLRARIASGTLPFVVGTHALIQPGVRFADLGMIVIDEQHRFGVRQRLAMQEKGKIADFLLMSATPIPQTLAQTVYDDLEFVSIRGLPPGRKPVETHVVPERKREGLVTFVRERLMNGGDQAYYVLPRIEAGDDEEGDIADVESTYKRLAKTAFAAIPTALVHGRLPPEEKEQAVERFRQGKIKLLFATTVVEVGVDVPGATIMVIENAERFGLSQLHQLRGRIGRGGRHSYCFLFSATAEGNEQIRERLERFRALHDGFALAELDLALRGPGQISGYDQSGWDDETMRVVLRDPALFREVQAEVDSAVAAVRAQSNE